MIALERYHQALADREPVQRSGRVLRVVGLGLVASGPAVPVGELCLVHGRDGTRQALVSGFREGELILQPLGGVAGISPGDLVESCGHGLEIPVGPGLMGRVIDGVGRPLDGKGPIPGQARRPIHAEPPPALGRRPINEILETRIKAIDGLLTLGKGQRIGIFANAGLGKSVLLGELARQAKCDVIVLALVGERGREVGEFIDKVLGPEGLKRSVVIAATSDRPAVERLSASLAAHAVAEHFRDAGLDVLLMMDSVTRFCQAQREIGLASGEPPTARGFPPSAFAMLPSMLERAGTGPTGSVTALYTVLVDGETDEDPVAEHVRAIIDGHVILSRALADRAVYPAIDLGASVSRLAQDLVSADEFNLGLVARRCWGEYQRVRDLVEIGAYQRGADPEVDQALDAWPKLLAWLRQGVGDAVERADALAQLAAAVGQTAPGEGADP